MATKNREELYELFYTGKKPTADDFVDLIDSAINIEEDGIGASQPGKPMEILARGNKKRFLDFSLIKDTPIWRVNALSGDELRAGFNLTSGNQTRVFVTEDNGFTGINTDNPEAKLHVAADANGSALKIDNIGGTTVLQIDRNGDMGIGSDPVTGTRLTVNGKVNLDGEVTISQRLNADGGITVTGSDVLLNDGLTVLNGMAVNTGLLEAKAGATISGSKAIITRGAVLSNGTTVSDDILNTDLGLSVSNGASIETGGLEAKEGATISGGLSVNDGITINGHSSLESGALTSKGGIFIIEQAPFSANGNVTLGFKDETTTTTVTVNGSLVATAGAEISGERLIAGNGLAVQGDAQIGTVGDLVTFGGSIIATNSLTVENANFSARGNVALGNEQSGDISAFGRLTASKGITITGGSFIANGSAEVDSLTVSSSADLTGPVSLAGDLFVTGNLTVNDSPLVASGAVSLGNSGSGGTVTAVGTLVGENGAEISGDLTAPGNVRLGKTVADSLDVDALAINSELSIDSLKLTTLSAADTTTGDLSVDGACYITNDARLAQGKLNAVYRGPSGDSPRIVTIKKASVAVESGHYEIAISADKIVTISGDSASDVLNFPDDWEAYKINNPGLAAGFQFSRMGSNSWLIRNQEIDLASSGVEFKVFELVANALNVIYSGAGGSAQVSLQTDPDGSAEGIEFSIQGTVLTILIPYATSRFSILPDLVTIRHTGSISDLPHVDVILNTDAGVEAFQFNITGTTLTISLPQAPENQSVTTLLADWSAWKLANEALAEGFFIDQLGGDGSELVVETSGDLVKDTENHTVSSLQIAWSEWRQKNEAVAADFDLERSGGSGDEVLAEISGTLIANSNHHVMFKGAIHTNTVSIMGHLAFADADVAINAISSSETLAEAADTILPTQKAVKAYVDERAFLGGDAGQNFATSDLTVSGNFSLAGGHHVNEISNDTALVSESQTAIPTEYAVKTYADEKALKGGDQTVAFSTANLTINGTLGFLNGLAISEISNDTTLVNASQTAVPTEYAVKAYADEKALKEGDETVPFKTANLTINGTFGFAGGHPVNEVSNDHTLIHASQTAVPTEYAVKSYVDTGKAAKNGDTTEDFNAQNLVLSGTLGLAGSTVNKVTADISAEPDKAGSLPNAAAIVAYVEEATATNRTLNHDYNAKDVIVSGELGFDDNANRVKRISTDIDGEPEPIMALPTVAAVKSYAGQFYATKNGNEGEDFSTNNMVVKGNITLDTGTLSKVSANIAGETEENSAVPNVAAVKSYVADSTDTSGLESQIATKANLQVPHTNGIAIASGAQSSAGIGLTNQSSGILMVRVTNGASTLTSGHFAIHGNSLISKILGSDLSDTSGGSLYNVYFSAGNLIVENTHTVQVTVHLTYFGV